MAEGGSPRVSAPASRQLYIRTYGRRPRDEREIADVFQRYGEVRYVRLMPHRDSGFVSYWRTRDACEAREALHERSVNGMNLDVQFSRSTRLLHIDSVPTSMTHSALVELINSEFLRFGPLQSIDLSRDRRTVYITFQREADAIQCVAALQGHTIGEWKWEIEFHKERAPNPSSSSLEPPPPSIEQIPSAAQQPARSIRILEDGEGVFGAPKTATPGQSSSTPQRISITRSELAKRASQRTALASSGHEVSVSTPSSSHMPSSPKYENDLALADERTPEQPTDRRPTVKQEPSDSIRTSAPIPAAAASSASRGRSRSRSPKAKHRRRSATPDSGSPSSRSSSSSSGSRSPSPSHRKRKRSGRSRSPAAVASHTCDRCEELMRHWQNSHTERDNEMCKKIVGAWFRGNFEVIHSENDCPPGTLVLRRSSFLKKEVNPFLRSLGFRAWSSTSSLWTDWFLREITGLTPSQLRRSHDIRLVRRTSRAGYRDMLQSLLTELNDR